MNVDILDCTLRDGSYAVDFQFTAEDTMFLCLALESAGIRWIEVGHGLGLNASQSGHGVAANTDLEYITAARSVLKKAACGMFFIPGIGRMKDLEMAATEGLHFIRIGTNATELEQAAPFVARAKDLGLTVFSNLMKSYAVSPKRFGSLVKQAANYGVDYAVLVDSAGGMLPEDVRHYLGSAKEKTDIPLAFHGHDNMSLVAANSITAAEEGAVMIDTSLQGIGRSAGNAVTEVMVSIFKRKGMCEHLNEKILQNVGQRFIQPLLRRRGIDPIALTSGYALFHSSFFPRVRKAAEKYRVDVRDLIVQLCEEDRVNAPTSLIESLAQNLSTQESSFPPSSLTLRQEKEQPDSLDHAIKNVCHQIKTLAGKKGITSVLNIEIPRYPEAKTSVFKNVQMTSHAVIGSAMVTEPIDIEVILKNAEGVVDAVLLDCENKYAPGNSFLSYAEKILQKTKRWPYCDTLVWSESVCQQLLAKKGDLQNTRIGIVETTYGIRALVENLCTQGCEVMIFAEGNNSPEALTREVKFTSTNDKESIQRLDAMIGIRPYSQDIRPSMVEALQPHALVIDAGIGSLSPSALKTCIDRGLSAFRVDMLPAIAATIYHILRTEERVHQEMGRGILNAIPIVAGGELGLAGEIVVDKIFNPENVIGIADGAGGIKKQLAREEQERIQAAWQALTEQTMMHKL